MARRFYPRVAAALVSTALLVAGCGGESESSNSKPTIRNADPARWTEQQVIDAAGLSTTNNGISYATESGCRVAVILTSASAVEVYAGAGDTVVTNPDGTAGVKTSGADRQCLAELERGLAALR
ncbi:MAG TPA: hypothetical protein VMY78_13400 [Solirubrobacteraceae bacterium]|nr:hypothetical protein [Solirubrobacteraceae bacterium]